MSLRWQSAVEIMDKEMVLFWVLSLLQLTIEYQLKILWQSGSDGEEKGERKDLANVYRNIRNFEAIYFKQNTWDKLFQVPI